MSSTPSPAILELGPEFYDPVKPARFPKAIPRFLNENWAEKLGFTSLDWEKHFHRFEPLSGNLQEPLALRYHGHQFQHYNPDLGDGRGFLFAQVKTDENKLLDFGTKGSGQTPYSRAGDGRLTLKGAFREALATELLESLGVNTSKTFSVFETGENLDRNDEPSPTRSAVLTRLSHSHIRLGTFQRLAFLNQPENTKKLMDYCVRHYYPGLSRTKNRSLERAQTFLKSVSHSIAHLTAQYMMAGFVHGVLNSDNLNITGESFDYGPYRFLPEYNPAFTAAYFDHQGLYAFGRQPSAIFWNLHQLGVSLKVAFPELKFEEILEDFGVVFSLKTVELFFHRLNLKMKTDAENDELIGAVFLFMSKENLKFEQTLFDLFGGLSEARLSRSSQAKAYHSENFAPVRTALQKFSVRDEALLSNPYFQNSSPCTLLIEEIEALWKPIAESDDWSSFNTKIRQIRKFRGIYKMF